jgi:tetratricopeptide (TPR) repeat protein
MLFQTKMNDGINFSRLSEVFAICLLVLVAGGLYLNSINNIFTNWDDSMIYGNPQIRSLSWKNIENIFSYVKGSTYQPVRVLSYAVDYYFWKLDPLGYHITNILFYILTCLMVYLTLFQLSRSLREKRSPDSHERVALFGSLLFATHPVHVEAVTWLAARKEVLQGFFFFLAIWLYLKGRGRDGRDKIVYFGLVLLVILLAILSKPSAIVFPAVILVYEIAQRKDKWIDFVRSRWLFLVLSIFISIIFTYVLIKVMLDAGGVKPYRGGSFFNNLLVSFHVFLYNIKLLIFTINYSPAYTISVSNPILSLRTFIFVTITLLLIALSLWSLKHTKIIFFSFLFFLVTLLPYLNIIPISTLLADRYVFIGSFSSCFLLGIGFDRFYASTGKRFSKGFFKLLAITLFLFLLTGYSFMTIWQNRIWENSYTLWADAVEKYPDSNTANALMGVVYMDLAMDQDAIKHLEKAVRLVPYDYQSRNNLGIVYGKSGEPEKALKEFSTAIQLKPDDDAVKINLSVFYQRQKEYKKAEEVLHYLLLKSPQNANLHFRLGLIYRDAGRNEEAVSEFLKSVELAPHIINGYEELGNIYASKFRDFDKAEYYYCRGIEAVPKARLRVEDLRWMIQDLEAYK